MSGMYEDSFARARPNMAYSAVSQRLQLVRAVTIDLSSLFSERAEAEEAYIKALQRLNSRLQQGSISRAVDELGLGDQEAAKQLGAWRDVKKELEREVQGTLKGHEQWRAKILEEVEQPLRNSTAKGDWTRWDTEDRQLGETVKEYQSGLDRVQKEQSKASKSTKATSSKLITAQSSLSSLGSSLTSALPAFLATSQQLETNHSAFLKEALIRAGTFSADLGRERMEQGERMVAKILGIEEDVEMQTWALREGMKAGGGAAGGQGNAGGPSLAEFGTQSQSIREDSIAEEPSYLAPPAERQRVPSISRTAPPPVAPLPLPTSAASTTTPGKEKKSGGLKSLFKRNRDRSGSNASGNKAASSKYGQLDVPATSNGASTSRQAPDRQSIESRDSSLQQPEEAIAQPRFDRQNSGSSSLMGGSSSGMPMQAPLQPQSQPKKRDSLMPSFGGGGGGLFRRQSRMESPRDERAEAQGGLQEQAPMGSGQQVDEEGFSVPPAGYDRDITAAVGPTAGGSNLMDDDEDDEAGDLPSALHSSSNKLAPIALAAPGTITESEAERQAALARVQSTLLTSAPAGAGVARRATRGRRDVRTTTYQPTIPDDVPLAQVLRDQRSREASAETSQFASPISPTGSSFAAMDGGRTNSILSNSSSSALSPQRAQDLFEGSAQTGLRASIVETVNVLTKAGEVQRVMVTGEIALSHRGAGGEATRIRLTGFEELEKAAPNSAYITPVEGAAGEYTLLPSLTGSGAGETKTVLKYQLYIPIGSETAFVPLRVKAAWQCQQGQTRVIVQYSANSMSSLAQSSGRQEASPFGDDDDQAARLEDLTLQLPVNTAVSTFSAKPSASWSAERARLTFALEPLSLSASSSAGEAKALASLSTEGTASPQPVVVGWRVVGRTVSSVGVEVVGGDVAEVKRECRAGKYLAAA